MQGRCRPQTSSGRLQTSLVCGEGWGDDAAGENRLVVARETHAAMVSGVFLRFATVGGIVGAFVLGYVCGAARPAPAVAEVRPYELTVLQTNLDTLRRAWNGSRETTLRGLRLEPDAQGRYLVAGSSSQAESDNTLDMATRGADDSYQRSLQPPGPNSP